MVAMDDEVMLHVQSSDLHEHVAQEIGECLESGLYTDLMVRCKDGHTLHAHKLVLSAVSPYLKVLLEGNDFEELQTLEIPDASNDIVTLLLEVIYNGLVEASLDDLRELILLAHRLYINIPLSDELMTGLDLVLPPMPPLVFRGLPKLKQRPNFHPTALHSSAAAKPKLTPPPALKKPPSQNNGAMKREPVVGLNALMTSTALGKNLEHLCPICNSKYSNVGSFKQHMKMHDNDHLKEERNQILAEMVATCYDPNFALYTCHICNSNYNHSGNFKQHLLKHERESGSISAMLVAKVKEAGTVDINDPAAVLAAASAASTAATRVVTNNNGHGAEREPGRHVYNCEHCGRTFNHAGNYKQHVASHARLAATGRPSAKQLRQMKSLSPLAKRPKLSSSTSAAVLSCPECSLEFGNVDELESHILSFHQDSNDNSVDPLETETLESESLTSFPCNICGKSFDSTAMLVRHKRALHADDSDMSEESRNGLEWSSSASSQMTPKAKKVPAAANQPHVVPTYKCKICGKKFLTMSKLSMHMKIHSAPEEHYRFPCDICGKKFTRLQHVNRHKLLHRTNRAFKCNSCNRSFINEDQMRHHYSTECSVDRAETYEDQAPEDDPIAHEYSSDNGLADNNDNSNNGMNGDDEDDDEYDAMEIPAPNIIITE